MHICNIWHHIIRASFYDASRDYYIVASSRCRCCSVVAYSLWDVLGARTKRVSRFAGNKSYYATVCGTQPRITVRKRPSPSKHTQHRQCDFVHQTTFSCAALMPTNVSAAWHDWTRPKRASLIFRCERLVCVRTRVMTQVAINIWLVVYNSLRAAPEPLTARSTQQPASPLYKPVKIMPECHTDCVCVAQAIRGTLKLISPHVSFFSSTHRMQ